MSEQNYLIPAIALLGSLFGGAGLELIRARLQRNKEQTEAAVQLRAELRQEIIKIKRELNKVESELDSWRERYYSVVEKYLSAKLQLEQALSEIRQAKAEGRLEHFIIEDFDELLHPAPEPEATVDREHKE